MRENEHSNIGILKEIAELLNEETEIVTMLKGALIKFLNGTKFETGWIFLLMQRGALSLLSMKIYQKHWNIKIVII